jgi:twitching motility protein PilT
MPLVDSLLTAVVRSDGDALVLHVGEKPYVVAPGGAVELSRQGLGLGAMEGMLAQLLSADALRVLREMGAVEHSLDDRPAAAGDRFTVVAARGGDDIWIELRRHRRITPPPGAAAPVVVIETPPPPMMVPEAATAVEAPDPVATSSGDDAPMTAVVAADGPTPGTEAPSPVSATEAVAAPEPVAQNAAIETAPEPDSPVAHDAPAPAFDAPAAAPAFEFDASVPRFDAPVPRFDAPESTDVESVFVSDAASAFDLPSYVEPPAVSMAEPPAPSAVHAPEPPPAAGEPIAAGVPAVASVASESLNASAVGEPAEPEAADVAAPALALNVRQVASESLATERPVPASAEPAVAAWPIAPPPPVPAPAFASAPAGSEPVAAAASQDEAPPSPRAAWSAPTRLDSGESHFDPLPPQPVLPGLAPEFEAAHRHNESARYDAPDALPGVVLSLTRDSVRGSGGISRSTRPGGIERLLRLAAARGASALYLTTQARPAVRVDGDIRLLDGEPPLSSGDVEAAVLELAPDGTRDNDSGEWIRDLQDVGRVRITTFRDYRGPGALLRMIQARATSAEQLGLVREIQALATEPEGLVIVTGPRASGKSTLLSAFVDLINRQRNDYVITLEGQIRLVHESRGSLISQRELRGNAGEVVSAARSALRENPDVLVIEDLRSPEVLQVALDAAGLGLLVFVSITAASATAALERLVDLCPSEQRRTGRAALAEHLRGVVAQVLLRKAGGGRLAARELVLNTNAVAALVREGQISQLPRAIDSGRKLGMAPLNDALVAFVQSGAVDVREAYRKADDKAGLLALLKREGIDTSFVERLA